MLAQWIFPALVAIVVDALDIPGGVLLVHESAPISNWTDTIPSLNVFGLRNDKLANRKVGARSDSGDLNDLARGDHVTHLLARVPCVGYGLCPNGIQCCPLGADCCPDGSCCYAGSDCVRIISTGGMGCCTTGTYCPGMSPCQDDGYDPCPNIEKYCCPTGLTCYQDAAGTVRCRYPPTPTPTPIDPPITSPSVIPEPENLSSNAAPIGAIAGGVVSGIVFLALVAIGAFFYGKRRQSLKQSPPPAQDFAPQMQSTRPGPVGFAGGFNPTYGPQPGDFHSHPSSPNQYPGQPEIHDERPEAAAGALGSIYPNPPITQALPSDAFMSIPFHLQSLGGCAPVSNLSNRPQEFYPNTSGNTASFYGTGGSSQNPTPVSGQFSQSSGSPTAQPLLTHGAGRN